MKTYTTFQEAKLANPASTIHTNFIETVFAAERSDELCWIASASNHCMTIKDFLAAGFKFTKEDVCIFKEFHVMPVKENATSWSRPSPQDKDNHVLKAKALESKTRTKVEYVLAEFNSDKERAEAFLEGNLYRYSSGEVTGSVEEDTYPLEKLADMFIGVGIFRRIETEMSEKGEYLDWFDATRKELGSPKKFAEFLYDNGYRVIE